MPQAPMTMTITIGTSAKTEPTERSNSPAIMRIPTPRATIPSSGTANRMTRALALLANWGA